MSLGRRVVLLALFVAAGCEKTPPPKLSGLPPLDDAQKQAAVHPPSGDVQPAMEMPKSHPAVPTNGPTNMPANHPAVQPTNEAATPGGIAFDAQTVIAGELRVADAVKAKVAAGDTIFLIVRSAEQPGPPLAVRRLTAASFPMIFAIDGRDAMMAGTKLAGRVTVSARIDKDGDAMTKLPGDITGMSPPITPPVGKLVLTLDTVL